MDEKFVKTTIINKTKYFILKLDIDFTQLTELQWELFKNNLKNNLINIENNFILVFKFLNIDMVSTAKIREVVNIFYVNGKIIEEKLYFTIGIYNNKIINKFFEVIKVFYRTKKPLFFIDTIDELQPLIDEKLKKINKN